MRKEKLFNVSPAEAFVQPIYTEICNTGWSKQKICEEKRRRWTKNNWKHVWELCERHRKIQKKNKYKHWRAEERIESLLRRVCMLGESTHGIAVCSQPPIGTKTKYQTTWKIFKLKIKTKDPESWQTYKNYSSLNVVVWNGLKLTKINVRFKWSSHNYRRTKHP